ncbi:MAG: patatin-like phospholipase family protein [Gemmatimonadota bacterium]
MSRRITAVLSGGGAKAAAHLGALAALAAEGIVPTRYVGTSMGAVIGAGLASGLSSDQVTVRMRGVRREDVAVLDRTAFVKGLFAQSVFRGPLLRQTLTRLLPVRSFRDLVLPLSVTTADLDTGELVVFGAGGEDAPLADVLYASCALPVLYPHAELNGRRLADGGLRGVVAFEVAARFEADLVVAIDVGPGFGMGADRELKPPPALVRAHNDAISALMADNTRLGLALWRATAGRPPLLYIRPAVRRGETFAVDQIDAYIGAGRVAAQEALRQHRG